MAKSKMTTLKLEFDVPANKMKKVADQVGNIKKILEGTFKKKKPVKDKIIKSHTFSEEFPTLMKHDSGSIFLVCKFGLGYIMTCLSKGIKDEGEYRIGFRMNAKDLKKFKRMKSGFFIEFVVE